MSKRVKLSDQQKLVKQRLFLRAKKQLETLGKIASSRLFHEHDPNVSETSESFEALKTPRQSNCVGVFGRRGSGKTTVLVHLAKAIAKDKQGWKVIQRPMDLSYAPREFPHGLTIVHWLRTMLRAEHVPGPRVRSAEKQFDEVSRSYFRGADGFNQLVRDLAVSPEHYAASAASEIRLRLDLWRQMRGWLDAQCLEMEVAGFVVPVDDADLTPSNKHQSLIWSLLDELHQDRLFFIVAGDLDRLERRLAGEESLGSSILSESLQHRRKELDLARDIVYKVLPQSDRAELEPWPYMARAAFPPISVKYSSIVSIDNLVNGFEVDDSIRHHLTYLLPGWPRGLENVHRELVQKKEWADKKEEETADLASGNGKHVEHKRIPAREILGILANSNFDFDLARELRQRPAGDWAPRFQWAAGTIASSAAWEQIRNALSNDGEIGPLLPDLETSPLPLAHEPARWVELLLDLSLQRKLVSPLRLVKRIPWLESRLKQSSAELGRTEESLDRAVDDDPGGLLTALYWLRWIDPGRASVGQFSIGFWHIFELLVGDRVHWPDAMRRESWSPVGLARMVRESMESAGSTMQMAPSTDDVWARLASGSPDGKRPGGARAGNSDGQNQPDRQIDYLLPERTRELLGLVDKLAGQPWASLQRVDSRVGPGGLARLAAALSVRSYLECLELSLERAEGDRKFAGFSSGLRSEGALVELTGPLGGVGGQTIHELDETRIRELFSRIETAGRSDVEALREFDEESPLARALINLLEAPWFIGLAH